VNPRREDELAPEILVVSDDGEEASGETEKPRDDAPLVTLATHCRAFLRAHDLEEPTSEPREHRSRECRTEPS
jgi:hypothetical protein